ncbi:MAG: hypothetical protein JW739_03330 [Opitutales bacterium]|nr:hypothetical protein [Opitutales bacterium]
MAEVPLTAAIRSNLVSLKQTSNLLEQTTERLATGKKVSSAIDNPTNYFAALGYTERADGLSARLDGMGEAIQTIKAADNGITNMKGFLSQMKGVVNDALGETDSDSRADLGKQFNELLNQANQLVEDSGYGGINLMKETETLTVEFNERIGQAYLDVTGFNVEAGDYTESTQSFTASAVTAGTNTSNIETFALTFDVDDDKVVGIQSYGTTATTASGHEINWASDTYKADLADLVSQIEDVENALSTQASSLASNLAVITQREDFTNEHINILTEGADNLTLADLNEEGANLLALQTSQTLGIQALSLASQQSQAVLQLIG